MSADVHTIDKKVVILTDNEDGMLYTIEADSVDEVLNDWYGECNFVPECDALVYFASLNGVVLRQHDYRDFESLMHFLSVRFGNGRNA